jgi:hypothetical protein
MILKSTFYVLMQLKLDKNQDKANKEMKLYTDFKNTLDLTTTHSFYQN